MTLCLLLLLKRIVSRFRLIDNYCKCCGRKTEGFVTSDELYMRVVPDGGERCLRCFDWAARQRGISLAWRVTLEDGREAEMRFFALRES
jgi:hypothetical protein